MEADFTREIENWGKRLKQLRKHRKLTLLDLELLCGIADSKISRYERGLENIEFLTICRLAKALQVETKDMMDYKGPLPDSANFKKKITKSRKQI